MPPKDRTSTPTPVVISASEQPRPAAALDSRETSMVAGAEYQSARGLTFNVAAGYARLLQENLVVLAGAPSEADRSALRRRIGSGPVASVALGQAF